MSLPQWPPGENRILFDYTRRVAAALAYIAMGSGVRVILVPFSSEPGSPLRSGRDRAQIHPFLDRLSELEATRQTDLVGMTKWFDVTFNTVGSVILISDLWSPVDSIVPSFDRLAAHGRELVVLHTFLPEDRAPVHLGPLNIEDSESGDIIKVNMTSELIDAYTARWHARCDHLEHEVLRRGGVYVKAPVDLPIERLILDSLGKGGISG